MHLSNRKVQTYDFQWLTTKYLNFFFEKNENYKQMSELTTEQHESYLVL